MEKISKSLFLDILVKYPQGISKWRCLTPAELRREVGGNRGVGVPVLKLGSRAGWGLGSPGESREAGERPTLRSLCLQGVGRKERPGKGSEQERQGRWKTNQGGEKPLEDTQRLLQEGQGAQLWGELLRGLRWDCPLGLAPWSRRCPYVKGEPKPAGSQPGGQVLAR